MERGTHVKRLGVLAGLAVTALLGTAACGGGGSTGGFSTAAPTTTSQTADSAGASTSSSSGGSQSLDANKPCSLLSSSDLAALGSTSTPYQDKTGDVQTCELTTATFGAQLGVEKLGLSQVQANGGTVNDVPINGRQGKEVVGPQGGNGCLVAVPLTETSRVDISAVMNDASATGQQTCTAALQVAKLVEPHLPPES